MLPEGHSVVRKALIVEDDPMISINLEDMLTELGHFVIATATRIGKALTLAEDSDINFGFLDINLAGANTFQVADILRKRKIPFIFTSGYGADGLIDGYRTAHVLTKPFGIKELEHMIGVVLSER